MEAMAFFVLKKVARWREKWVFCATHSGASWQRDQRACVRGGRMEWMEEDTQGVLSDFVCVEDGRERCVVRNNTQYETKLTSA